MEDPPELIYASKRACLFSNLRDGKFEKAWKPWSGRFLFISTDAILLYKLNPDTTPKRKLDVKSVKVVPIPMSGLESPVGVNEIGILVECKENGYHAAFKCVMSFDEAELLLWALRKVAVEHNIDEYQPIFDAAKLAAREQVVAKSTRSNMRRSIAYRLDLHEKRSRHERIIAKRGAFEWLPVAFTNDLVHGSWWYVLGSFFTVLFPMFIIIGNHDARFRALGYDDDALTENSYDWTWTLMMISGVFFTFGSVAFLRAVNDPPMRPVFAEHPGLLGKHFGTDELLGSWNFVFACVPFVPYAFIYFNSNPSDPMMMGLVVVSVAALVGSGIFLVNCYPSQDEAKPFILPMLLCCNCRHCCCSERLIDKHLQNDWLAGTWIILWTTAFGTFITFLAFAFRLYDGTMLAKFSDGCTFLDCLMFLIGSLYFVSGSYPEKSKETESAGLKTGRGDSAVVSDVEAVSEVELNPKEKTNVYKLDSSTNPLMAPLNP